MPPAWRHLETSMVTCRGLKNENTKKAIGMAIEPRDQDTDRKQTRANNPLCIRNHRLNIFLCLACLQACRVVLGVFFWNLAFWFGMGRQHGGVSLGFRSFDTIYGIFSYSTLADRGISNPSTRKTFHLAFKRKERRGKMKKIPEVIRIEGQRPTMGTILTFFVSKPSLPFALAFNLSS